ncbi:Flp family type IVb pilin [Acidiphilium sp.]|uniref:Flp family type IVb pilin n=1 Tax=Acidiphilium sp. TaxID=527 RepID=UPI0025906E98|nr:Flp family type IVb pilin [Acidiphilium sp.]
MTTMLPRRRRGATAIEYGLIAGLVLIVALGFLTLTGVNLKNIFDGLGTSLQNSVGVPYASNCGPASQVNINYYANWPFPLYACGQYGIAGPANANIFSLANDSYGTYAIGYTNSSGQTVPYASKISYTETVASGSSGTAFNDGFSYNAAFVNGSHLSFSTFQSICQAGGNSLLNVNNAVGLTNNFGTLGPAPVYAPGTAYKTSSGGYVCSSSLISGTLLGAT